MFHSIVIPHRNRNRRLGVSAWSLERSAIICGIPDGAWEILVVDSDSRVAPLPGLLGPHVRVVVDASPAGPFCKSRALNLGLERARGDALTFLDADAIVGKRFLDCHAKLEDRSLHRVCYRVRTVPEIELPDLEDPMTREASVQTLFDRYERFGPAYEAYGRYDRDLPARSSADQPWGNSQFSIRRETLGDLRWDEQYVGRGYQDLDFNMRLAHRLGSAYRAAISIDAEHAMLHVQQADLDPEWSDQSLLRQNARRYRHKQLYLATEGAES